MSAEEATWEPYEQMKIQHPYFDLEGKVDFRGKGNDTTMRDRPAGKEGHVEGSRICK